MAEKLGLGPEVRELKLGASFTNPRSTAFHTVRYDFKPASVDVNKSATIDVGSNNQITVNVPHLDGAGTSQTVFKGSQKPYQKECVLIIDKNTGKITLERLTSNIQVKKTRSEALHKPLPPHLADKLEPTPNSSSTSSSSSKMGSKLSGGNKSRKERQSLPISKHSPRHPASSPASHHSPARSRSPVKREPVSLPPPPAPKSASASPVAPPSLAASLPLIGMDDFPMVSKPAERMEKSSPYSKPYKATPAPEPTTNKGKHTSAGSLSDSSSSSSSSSDDSESDNDVNTKALVNNFSSLNSEIKVSDSSDSDSDDDDDHETYHIPATKPSMPAMTNPIDHVLNEDLCLSESGSESD